jgi:hypothetical protein
MIRMNKALKESPRYHNSFQRPGDMSLVFTVLSTVRHIPYLEAATATQSSNFVDTDGRRI